jgi:hypothetical protein
MKKHQIDAEPGVIDPQTPLPADEGKIVAKLQQEICKVLDECRF